MVLQINKLPNYILIGRQTENGVNEIEIDVSEWLEHWPGMNISIMHTRPGDTYAYPAATRMTGSCIVWEISNADTAIHGLGTVEIMGILDGKKKLSRIVQTHISKTTTATTSDIPDAAKPWVDDVLDAAHRAEEAANEIKGMNVEVQTLEPGTQATAEWNSGLLKLGIPAGKSALPKDGNPGDILVKTETGSEWQKQEPATSTPDWNQNDPTASDYIKNRPGGYTVNYPALNIEWDGVIGDRVSVDVNGMKFVKVSDEIPKIGQLVGGVFIIKNGDVSDEKLITDRNIVDLGNGIYGSEAFLVVNKAPANFVTPGTSDVLAVLPETGVYFLRMTESDMHVSSLSLPAKSEIVPIPGELTNIVGGYVRAERNEPLIDSVIPASSFEIN